MNARSRLNCNRSSQGCASGRVENPNIRGHSKMKRKASQSKQKAAAARTRYFKQSDFPRASLQSAQRIAAAIVQNFAGDSASPPDIALAMGISPTSSAWQTLTGASIAYGLTDGGYNA